MCARQDLGRERSIVQCVTLTVDVYQVFDCVCLGVVLIKHRSESQWPVLLGYLALSTNVNCYYRIIYVNFVFQQDSVAGASYIQHSPTAAVQNCQLPEIWPNNSPELNSTDSEI